VKKKGGSRPHGRGKEVVRSQTRRVKAIEGLGDAPTAWLGGTGAPTATAWSPTAMRDPKGKLHSRAVDSTCRGSDKRKMGKKSERGAVKGPTNEKFGGFSRSLRDNPPSDTDRQRK